MKTMKNNNKDWACLERSLSVSVSEAVSNDEPFVGSPHAPVSRPAKSNPDGFVDIVGEFKEACR
jgi:hypothetical protein